MSVTSPYVPPGVSVTELSTQTINPLLASPADVCIIGLPGSTEAGYVSPITVTDTIIIGIGTVPVPVGYEPTPIVLPTIANLNSDASLVNIISVTNVNNPSYGATPGAGYVEGTDYTFTANSEGPPDGEGGTITALLGGAFYPEVSPPTDPITYTPTATLIAVTYTYTPTNYWNPIRLYDIGSVQTRFGNIWATGTIANGQTVYTGINSQLSLAAALAFQNGAQSVICQPLFTRATPGNPATAQQPATGETIGLTSTWSDTLYPLRSIVNLDIIVPIIGVDGTNITTPSSILAIFETIQGHEAYQNTQQLYVMGIFGEDGTANSTQFNLLNPPTSTLRSHAAQLQSNYGNVLSQQNVLINTSVFNISVPGAQGGTISVGGQYAAAALAGAIAGRPVASAMTRQTISGFQSITDNRAPSDKNADAGAGLLVLENYNNTIRCRQGITLDIIDGPAKQEISVVRSNFLLMESIQQTLDGQVVGQIIADANSALVVQSAITGVLALLQGSNTIVSYSAVAATLSSLNPATITASFSYAPAFPVNYIQVSFSLDLTTGSITNITTAS